jgi:hypothetical protein
LSAFGVQSIISLSGIVFPLWLAVRSPNSDSGLAPLAKMTAQGVLQLSTFLFPLSEFRLPNLPFRLDFSLPPPPK